MRRPIVGFHQDEDADWVAELACGHTQHVRHRPPWQERAWVLSEQERARRLGTELECPYCDMAALPPDVAPYKRSPTFSAETVPEALLREHRTRAGVWAQIVVEEGKLEYVCPRGTFVLRPGVTGVVEPERPHHVRLLPAARFHVVFLR
ncbi:MAG TPA: DUF3565 domain-containing protein [Polyangiaceae bacterium]|nr:DUF3565 domain-containing protein [Polyangiaceae bacterium]